VFLGAHGSYFDMLGKHEKAKAGAGESAWIDPEGYKAVVEERQRAFEKELKRQEMTQGSVKSK
jgi:metallo-beta-lactamase class B